MILTCTHTYRRFIVPAKVQPLYYSYPKENQKVMGQLFFFGREKIFGRKNFSEKKKVEKKCAFSEEPCKFSESPQRYGCKNGFGGPFFVKKIAKTLIYSVLCYAKNHCLSNFCVLFFCRQNVLQKSREDKPPSCFAKV